MERHLVLQKVHEIRSVHRRMGGRKLYEKLELFMLENGIKMGRDALFDLLSANNLLVKKRRSRKRTTNSHHWYRKYPNLVKGKVVERPNELWVSDMTYWKIRDKYVYISFITDAYSHKIVGSHVSPGMTAEGPLNALKMALKDLKRTTPEYSLIHHSDRGIQYCSDSYVKTLKKHGISISMTQSSDPLDNAIAERINGIIKHEYLYTQKTKDLKTARKQLDQAVRLYNNDRPHFSIGLLEPELVHSKALKTQKLWKNYYPSKNSEQAKNKTVLNH